MFIQERITVTGMWKGLNQKNKLVAGFASVILLLIIVGAAALAYLNSSASRLTESLYRDVHGSSGQLLNAGLELQEASSALRAAWSAGTAEERGAWAESFRDRAASAAGLAQAALDGLPGGASAGSARGGLPTPLAELAAELAGFAGSAELYAAQGLAALAGAGAPSAGAADAELALAAADAALADCTARLEQAAVLLDQYAGDILASFEERKNTVFSLYTLLLFILLLVIIHLGQRISRLHNTMQAEQLLYRQIGETMSDLIVLADPQGLIVYASPSHEGVLGYVPQVNTALTHYTRKHEMSASLLQNAAQGAPRITELRMRHAGGGWVWLESKISLVGSGSGYPARYMLVSREITQRKQHEEHLHKLAFYDHLTSIPNRAHFKMYMENLLTQPDRPGRQTALVLLDCDKFKLLNDTLGHLAGDEFLQLLSRDLQQTVGGGGRAFRIGGDEFAVVLNRADDPLILDAMLNAILQLFNKTWGGGGTDSFTTSASIGVALFPRHGTSINGLLRAADIAMYRAKGSGGNRALLYDRSMEDDSLTDAIRERDLGDIRAKTGN